MDGIDGIQSNMTNTMNTPIEDMERSLPVLIKRYEFRADDWARPFPRRKWARTSVRNARRRDNIYNSL